MADTKCTIDVIIPAFNEEQSVGKVVGAIDKNLVREVIVVNNDSNDQTAVVAKAAGATVLDEPHRGYGSACLKGIHYLDQKSNPPEIVVFMDADFSDHPEEMQDLVKPIECGKKDFVVGSRVSERAKKGSITIQQRLGNLMATKLIRVLYGVKFSDLGPFRAIRFASLKALNMKDQTFGWTAEMQIKAAKQKLRIAEIPVSYRKRIGESKISGTIKGTVLAGYRIMVTIFKYI